MIARFVWIRHGAATRFTRVSEWVGALAAAGLVTWTMHSVWRAASPDPRLATQAVVGWLVAAAVAGRTDEWLATRWSDGALAADLVRPFSLGEQLLLRDLGRAAAGLLAVALPWCAVFAASWPGIAVLPALVLAALAGHAFGVLSGVATVMLGAPAGTTWVRASVLALLSGAAIPPSALGPSWSNLLVFGPFGALAAGPAALWTGAGTEVLLAQGGWTAFWVLCAHAALRAARGTLGATGG